MIVDRSEGPGSRLPVLRRAVVVAGLALAVVGGVVTWRAVDRLDEAHTRAALARNDMADVRASVGARLDEAAGRVGLDNASATDDDALRHYLSDLVEAAGGSEDEAAVLVADIITREAELRRDAAEDGGPDEVLLFAFESQLSNLERVSVRPASADARAADSAARWTVATVFVLSAALWAAAALLTRAIRR